MEKPSITGILYFPLAIIDRFVEFSKLIVVCYGIETAESIITKTLATFEHTINAVDNTASTAANTLQMGMFASVLSKVLFFI